MMTTVRNGKTLTRSFGLNEREVIHGGAVHVRDTMDNRVDYDIITDGKREFGPDTKGQYEQQPGDAAATFKEQLNAIFGVMAPGSGDKEAQFAGHDVIDGTDVSIFTWSSSPFWYLVRENKMRWSVCWPTSRTTWSIWIADGDHRPLKIREKSEPLDESVGQGQVVQMVNTVFSYDPSVEVPIPPQ